MNNNRELDQRIGTLLGWRLEEVPEDKDGWFCARWRTDNYDPTYLVGRSRQEAIDVATENHLPKWSSDLNVAITLWSDDARWSVYPSEYPSNEGEQGRFCGTFPLSGDQSAGWVYADTPALAICEAWLKRQQWFVARNIAQTTST